MQTKSQNQNIHATTKNTENDSEKQNLVVQENMTGNTCSVFSTGSCLVSSALADNTLSPSQERLRG